MNSILTISIPTYNRLNYLKECLSTLLPQVEMYQEDVHVLVTDNRSTDGTMEYLEEISTTSSFLTYHRNKENLGYSGNQINCIQMSNGKYTAILCDDDLYTEEAIENILAVLRLRDYSFVALNYFSFKESQKSPVSQQYAPSHDKEFSRPFDILNYPSVGHFSGFIFNTAEAKQVLKYILEKYDYNYYEQHRGIVNDVAARQLSKSSLPSYFIGKKLVAARMHDVLDYNSFSHLCIEYYKYYLKLFNEGIINHDDLIYRKYLVTNWMPRMAFSSLYNVSKWQIQGYWKDLKDFELITNKNRFLMKAVFQFSKNGLTKRLMKFIHRSYRVLKK